MTNAENLLEISGKLENLAKALEAAGATTLEQWSAIQLVRDASRYLFSAGAWLMRHDDRYGGGATSPQPRDP
jgi:hypothetical protein